MNSSKVCGEVRLRLREFWDLPVGIGRTCFFTAECGNDCFYRSECFQTEQEKEYETPVAKATLRTETSEVDMDVDWRDKSGTIRFFLRGRVSQAVRLQVWLLPKDVMAWDCENVGYGMLPKNDVFSGVPAHSVCFCRVSFPADTLRLSKGEYAGWVAMYPQGCVFLRLLQRRKVGGAELFSLNLFGGASPTLIKMASTRSSEGAFSRGITREFGLIQDDAIPAMKSPWRDVASTGFTAEAIDHLIDFIASADRELAEPLVHDLLRGRLLPMSFVRVLTIAVFLGCVPLVRGWTEYSLTVNVLNVFVLFMLALGAIRKEGDDEGRPRKMGDVQYGVVLAERRCIRPMAKALASNPKMLSSGRGGLVVSILLMIAVCLQTLVDVSRFFRHPSRYWRSVVVVTLVWSVPWTCPKLWRVGGKMLLVVLVGNLTPYQLFNRVLANLFGGLLVLTGRQRQTVLEPLYWVAPNIPKGWSGGREAAHDVDDEVDGHISIR